MPGLLAILVLLSLAFAASAQAADPVTNQNDSGPGSLRNALATADPVDVIVIPPGTYRLTTEQLVVNEDDVTLRGRDGAGVTRIEPGNFRALCITTGRTVIEGLTIHGGQAAPGGGGNCADSQGGGIHSEVGTEVVVRHSVIQHARAFLPQGEAGGGGGIFAAEDLTVEDSVVRDNTTSATAVLGDNGGGGIRSEGSALRVSRSSISGNTATVGGGGGGGIYSEGAPTLQNVTLSGNRHLISPGALPGGGGGALFTPSGGSVVHATFFGNHSDSAGGAIVAQGTTLRNSLFHANTAPSDPDCTTAASTGGGNLSSEPSAACFGSQDLAGGDPNLGPLAVNGGANGTFTHEILSRDSDAGGDRDPVEFPTEQGVGCPLDEDQRGISRTRFGECDSGAYEFDGRAVATIPECSPTGVVPLTLDAPPGHTVAGVSYRVGADPTVLRNDVADSGDPLTPASVTLDEGRLRLEYWGRWDSNSTNDVPEEAGHGLATVLVDKTRPAVDVQSVRGQSIFVITRRERVNITAADVLSGLVQDPSATGVRIDTGSRGTASVARTAADLCQNQATDSFDYRVLAPGLGIRTVLENVKGRVRVRSAGGGSGARASQKGRPFSPLSQPRELPIGSFIDARRGTTRLTSARTRREDRIQDGLFSAGLFQVLQSRRRRAKGLTEVRLKGGNFRRRCRRSGKGGPGAAQVRRRVVRRLRGNSRGRFRTSGRHSAATVRGTVWQVIDRCDGTLTKVTRGRVAVRDFRRKKTVIVRAGKSYLARAPR